MGHRAPAVLLYAFVACALGEGERPHQRPAQPVLFHHVQLDFYSKFKALNLY